MWRNIWIRDVFCSQRLWCCGKTRLESIIKNVQPHFIYDAGKGQYTLESGQCDKDAVFKHMFARNARSVTLLKQRMTQCNIDATDAFTEEDARLLFLFAAVFPHSCPHFLFNAIVSVPLGFFFIHKRFNFANVFPTEEVVLRNNGE